MQKGLLIAVATACSIGIAGAQAPNAPAFDVASIKPALAGVGDQYISAVQPGGRYIGMNITTRMLIKIAYGVHDSQIIGGPAWTNTDRFDINAKAEGYPDAVAFRDTARLMLRPLLTDRFKLTLRREQRELPIYAMTVAKPGELGPRLQPDDGRECTTPRPPIPIPISPSGVAPGALICGGEMFASGVLMGRALTLSTLAITLTRFADRVVVDETGLTGKFDWHIFWLPDEIALSGRSIDGPSMFSAFRDEAGLKLEPRRRPVEVLVVERAEHPEPD
jgi:uncharacterized protein (TIGR03435 family)